MVQKNGSDKLIARIVYEGPVQAPIQPGQKIGSIKVWRGANVAVEEPLYASDPVAVGTTMHADLDYEVLRKELPANVIPAYDGMQLTLDAA